MYLAQLQWRLPDAFRPAQTASIAVPWHDFSDAFLENYLTAVGEKVCSTVGAYRLEEYGVHLFESIDGDYFTILGLPLLALLSYLRDQQIVE